MSRNSDPSRIYFLTIFSDLCPVCCMIARSLTPVAAALVARPARREWPLYCSGSRLAASAYRFTTRATPRSERRTALMLPSLFLVIQVKVGNMLLHQTVNKPIPTTDLLHRRRSH